MNSASVRKQPRLMIVGFKDGVPSGFMRIKDQTQGCEVWEQACEAGRYDSAAIYQAHTFFERRKD